MPGVMLGILAFQGMFLLRTHPQVIDIAALQSLSADIPPIGAYYYTKIVLRRTHVLVNMNEPLIAFYQCSAIPYVCICVCSTADTCAGTYLCLAPVRIHAHLMSGHKARTIKST